MYTSVEVVPDDKENLYRVQGRWNVPMTSLSIGGGSVLLDDHVATLESDFPFIALREEYVTLLNNYMGMETRERSGAPSIDCAKRDELDDMTIGLGDHEFVIGPYEYTWEVYLEEWEATRCVSAFIGLDWLTNEKYVLLGSAFLRHFYGVFDVEEGTVSLGKVRPLKGKVVGREDLK